MGLVDIIAETMSLQRRNFWIILSTAINDEKGVINQRRNYFTAILSRGYVIHVYCDWKIKTITKNNLENFIMHCCEENQSDIRWLERFSTECDKTKTKLITYKLGYSVNLKIKP